LAVTQPTNVPMLKLDYEQEHEQEF